MAFLRAKGQKCRAPATSVEGKKSSATRNLIQARRLVRAAQDQALRVCSAGCLRNAAQARGTGQRLILDSRVTDADTDSSYIKELADRIHSIENKLESDGNLNQDDIDKLFATDRSRQSNGLEDASRKRPFSSISTAEFTTPITVRQAPWGSENRSIQPASAAGETLSQEYDNASLAPQATPIKAADTPSRQPDEAADVGMDDAEEMPDIDDEAYEQYVSRSPLTRAHAHTITFRDGALNSSISQFPRIGSASIPYSAVRKDQAAVAAFSIVTCGEDCLQPHPALCWPDIHRRRKSRQLYSPRVGEQRCSSQSCDRHSACANLVDVNY